VGTDWHVWKTNFSKYRSRLTIQLPGNLTATSRTPPSRLLPHGDARDERGATPPEAPVHRDAVGCFGRGEALQRSHQPQGQQQMGFLNRKDRWFAVETAAAAEKAKLRTIDFMAISPFR
jgi:hypothetical protein